MNPTTIEEFLSSQKPWLIDFLSGMLRIPSLSGQEQDAVEHLFQELSSLGINVLKLPIEPQITKHSNYSNPLGELDYHNRCNLKVQSHSHGLQGVPTIAFNTHIDVVPPSTNHTDPFIPSYVGNGLLSGRGSVDAKGQIAVLVLLLRAIEEFGPLPQNIVGHIVVEEEIGGNGTLSILKEDEHFTADFLFNLEPTDLRIKSSARGALWFEMTFFGEPSHSGSPTPAKSAITKAIAGIELLTEYHQKLWQASRDYGLFSAHPNPMPLTIGRFNAGKYPSMVAEKAVVSGVLGFLPNTTKAQVMTEVKDLFVKPENAWITKDMKLDFTYRHNGFETSIENPILASLAKVCHSMGLNPSFDAMTASSDAIYYSELGIPSVIFGPGKISVAHSNQERIDINEILLAVEVIYKTLESLTDDEMKG